MYILASRQLSSRILDDMYSRISASYNHDKKGAAGYISFNLRKDDSVEDLAKDLKEKYGFVFVKDEVIFVSETENMVLNQMYDGLPNQEQEFNKGVLELVASLYDKPIEVDVNPTDSYVERCIPTVIIWPKNIHYNYGNPQLSDSIFPVTFNNLATIASSSSFFSPGSLYLASDYPDRCVILPFALVYANWYGYGNTVILSVLNPDFSEGNPQAQNFQNLLLEKTIWEKILFDLATLPIEVIKEIQLNCETPFEFQMKFLALLTRTDLIKTIKKKEQERAKMVADIEVYKKNAISLGRNLLGINSTLEELNKSLNKKVAINKYKKDIEAINKLPYIKKTEIDGASINFFTEPIQIDDGPILGGYQVSYRPQNRILRITNLVNPMRDNELAHPHIPQGSEACFGNFSDIQYTFEMGEFLAGIELLHVFLSTYNPEDEWGRRLAYWDAKYTVDDMKERGLLGRMEGYVARLYQEQTGNSCDNFIYDDDEEDYDDEEEHCEYCGRPIDDCICWICYVCGGRVEHGTCTCERCENCHHLLQDCQCNEERE